MMPPLEEAEAMCPEQSITTAPTVSRSSLSASWGQREDSGCQWRLGEVSTLSHNAAGVLKPTNRWYDSND